MNFKTGFWGFLLGGLTGAAIALLVAPQSGEETREILSENSQKMKEEALSSIQEAQDIAIAQLNEAQVRLEKLNKETRKLFTQLQTIGKTTLEEQKNVLDNGSVKAKEDVSA
jgi:gas vesicle protein